ncbi:MAG: endo-1,4-beta-xylanase [Gemmataceae bacterium]
MKTKLPPVLLAAFVAASASLAPADEPDRRFYIYPWLGQSNKEGNPWIKEQDRTEVERLMAVDFPMQCRKAGHWYTAVTPLCRLSANLGPADHYRRPLVANLPKKVTMGVVNVAVAGCRWYGDKMVAQFGHKGGEPNVPATPTTYCNPLPLPNYPVGKRARDAKVGEPVPRDDGLWLVGKQEQFRELADVSVLWHDGVWYLYPSVDMAWVSKDGGATWQHHPLNVRDLGYAPTVVKHKEKFLLMASESSVYSADSPLGPFKEIGPIKLPQGVPGQTDPMLFSDDDGRLFYYWGCTPTEGIYGVELDADNPTKVIGKPVRVIAFEPEKAPWQQLGDWNEQPSRGWVEGAWMLKRDGRYYLTYAAGGTENRTYAMGCSVGKSPLGPFTPQKNNPVLRTTTGLVTGTAHGCVVEGPHKSLWAFYTVRTGVVHGFERRLGMDPATIGADGELCVDGASSLPRRLSTSPKPADPTGWLPLNSGPKTVGSTDGVNLSGRLAVDDDLRTWWQPAADDRSPTLTSNLTTPGAVVRAVRVAWRDVGLNTKAGVKPGAFRYRVEVRTAADMWTTVIDRGESTEDLLIDYRECQATPGTAARLIIVGAPPGITPGVAEFTVFGEVRNGGGPALKDVFKTHFRIGMAGDIPGGYSAAELALVTGHFGAVTPENCMKPGPVHPAEGRWNFERPDALVKWCGEKKLSVHGHTLVWHAQTNNWFFEGGDKAVITKRMKDHITRLVGRYKGKVQSWDVVNEAINDRGDGTTARTENLRNSPWLKALGPQYLTLAFKYAHEADPDARLYYNDYNIEVGPKHESSMVLLRRLIKEGAPIHGVGIQGHWSTANVPYDAIDRAIRDYASLGLKVSITELDVTIHGAAGGQFGPGRPPRTLTPPSVEDLKAQAAAYAKLFAIFIKHKDVIERVTFWGLNDRRTWRYGQHPLIFDSDNQPKPAYVAIVAAARRPAPTPPAELPTPSTGFDRKREGIERGKVETVEYESKATGTRRKMLVYTPPGFSKDRKYPVLYLLHGGGDDETGWVKKGAADVILDNLFADKKAVPMIVVMPNGRVVKPGKRPASPFAGFDAFEKDLISDVIPYVETHYPVKAGREHRVLAGLSMGGLQTLDIGLTHLDVFASLGVFSSGWFPDRRVKFEKENQGLLKAPETNRKLKLFWIANGKPDIAYKNNQAMLEMFDRYGLRYTYNEGRGGHTWDSWKNHLYVFAPLLFRDGR